MVESTGKKCISVYMYIKKQKNMKIFPQFHRYRLRLMRINVKMSVDILILIYLLSNYMRKLHCTTTLYTHIIYFFSPEFVNKI